MLTHRWLRYLFLFLVFAGNTAKAQQNFLDQIQLFAIGSYERTSLSIEDDLFIPLTEFRVEGMSNYGLTLGLEGHMTLEEDTYFIGRFQYARRKYAVGNNARISLDEDGIPIIFFNDDISVAQETRLDYLSLGLGLGYSIFSKLSVEFTMNYDLLINDHSYMLNTNLSPLPPSHVDVDQKYLSFAIAASWNIHKSIAIIPYAHIGFTEIEVLSSAIRTKTPFSLGIMARIQIKK